MIAAIESDSCVLRYCRPGFETECAAELAAEAAAAGIGGTGREGAGFVIFELAGTAARENVRAVANWRNCIFARQSLIAFAQLADLPRADRLTSIMAALSARNERFSDAWVEAPDTEEGKALAPFCKSFGNALIGGLKKARLLEPGARRRLHAFFPQSDNVYLASADPAATAPWPQGIPRLKFPREAPSRSTLKLEEALLVLLDEGERERWLKPGMSAVDLGAAPGGWTWQLVRRSLRVTAVDNGPMDAALLQSGLVTHRREDGFRFRPARAVDWMVCDMVEQPRRIAELIARWLGAGWCRYTVFNLKLPMKKRYEETRRCLQIIADAAQGGVDLRARQLYHDREEITVFGRVATRKEPARR